MNKTLVLLISTLLFGCTPASEPREEQPKNTETATQVETANVPTDTVEWVLKKADIVFTSTKTDKNGNNIQEMGNFSDYSAVLDKQGHLTMKIDLASVNTDIAIRDQRLTEWLFGVDKFTTAVISAELDATKINNLQLNTPLNLAQPIKLEMHGQQAEFVSELTITRTSPHIILVETKQPIELNLEQFDMLNGLKRLQDVMMLSGINAVVPVIFKGSFQDLYNI